MSIPLLCGTASRQRRLPLVSRCEVAGVGVGDRVGAGRRRVLLVWDGTDRDVDGGWLTTAAPLTQGSSAVAPPPQSRCGGQQVVQRPEAARPWQRRQLGRGRP
jgi:hypothetical protein